LFEAGADVFRLNFSHGDREEHERRYEAIRIIEREAGRPIAVIVDLKGPKLRIGAFAEGKVTLTLGSTFNLDLDGHLGDQRHVSLPHPEVFQSLTPGIEILLDDGKVRLQVESCGRSYAQTRVVAGGLLSDHKRVSIAGAVLPLAALTPKDRDDLAYGLELGADWIALSFVQYAQGFVGDRASNRAFRSLLEDWRERLRRVDEDPLGEIPSEEIGKKKIDKLLIEGDPEAAGLIHGVIEEFAQELATVIRRLLRLKSWRDTECIVVGGGLRDSRAGEVAIGRATVVLKAEGHAIKLVPIRHHPDEAGLIHAETVDQDLIVRQGITIEYRIEYRMRKNIDRVFGLRVQSSNHCCGK
jgi:pyruvate kinase-like protein